MPLPWDERVARVWVTCFRNREEREDRRLPHLGLPREPPEDPG